MHIPRRAEIRSEDMIKYGTALTLLIAIIAGAVWLGELSGQVKAFTEKGIREDIDDEVNRMHQRIGDHLKKLDEKEQVRANIHDESIRQLELPYVEWTSPLEKDTITTTLSQETVKSLCADQEGCLVQLLMKGWSSRPESERIFFSRLYTVQYDKSNGTWTAGNRFVQDGQEGGNGNLIEAFQEQYSKPTSPTSPESVAYFPPACLLAVDEYTPNDVSNDDETGIHLLSTTDSYSIPGRACGISIRD